MWTSIRACGFELGFDVGGKNITKLTFLIPIRKLLVLVSGDQWDDSPFSTAGK